MVGCLVLVSSIGVPGVAAAQWRGDCRAPQPPSLGISIGRSSPYAELAHGIEGAEPIGPVSVRGGMQLAARGDLPLLGPLRARLEAARSWWDIRQARDAGSEFPRANGASIAPISTRHLVALAGVRTGRAPVCAHVSAGGGMHAIGFRDRTFWRPGFAVGAGIELPTGSRGAIQLDATVHLVRTRDVPPLASVVVPSLNLLAGWAYRF